VSDPAAESFEEWCTRTTPPQMSRGVRLAGWIVLALGIAALRQNAVLVGLAVLAAVAWTVGDVVLARVRYARRGTRG
jgi:hypothetical protein